MATSDKEQQSELVPQHKRMAQGADIIAPSSKTPVKSNEGGLTQAKKK
jgi:hypothetical protein